MASKKNYGGVPGPPSSNLAEARTASCQPSSQDTTLTRAHSGLPVPAHRQAHSGRWQKLVSSHWLPVPIKPNLSVRVTFKMLQGIVVFKAKHALEYYPRFLTNVTTFV